MDEHIDFEAENHMDSDEWIGGAFVFFLLLFVAGCAACVGNKTQTPYMAQKELKYWIKVGDTLVDKEWQTDTIIITRINSDSSRVMGKENMGMWQENVMDYVPLYRVYTNLSNPNFKVSKPISIL